MQKHKFRLNYEEDSRIILDVEDTCLEYSYKILSDIIDDLVNTIKDCYSNFNNSLYNYDIKYDYSIIENNTEYIRSELLNSIDKNPCHLDMIYVSSVDIEYNLSSKDSILFINNLILSNIKFDDIENN